MQNINATSFLLFEIRAVRESIVTCLGFRNLVRITFACTVEQTYLKVISRETCMKVGYKILLLYMQYFLRYKQMKIANFARAHTKSGILFSGHVLMIKVDDCP